MSKLARRAACAGIAAAAILSGCGASSPVERRELGLSPAPADRVEPATGSRWEFVLGPEGAPMNAGPEVARLDAQLGVGGRASAYPLGMYPDPANRLDNARRFYLPRNPETVTYFNPGPIRSWWWY